MAEQLAFGLVSERALDSLCICGIKAKSTGQLPSSRDIEAANKTHICLYRPCIEGDFEEITQGEMDVFRAVTAKYVQEEVVFPFAVPDAPRFIDDIVLGSQMDTLSREDLPKLINDGAKFIIITPEEIRKRMGTSKQSWSSQKIQRALTKLSALKVKGTYKVRTVNGVQDVLINGNLFELETMPGSNNSTEFCLVFATRWGQLYLHNVESGNVTGVTVTRYTSLSNGAKTILMTIMSLPKPMFYRSFDDMAEIVNIKIGKNVSRAKENLKNYLNELVEVGYVTWTESKMVYTVTRKLESSLKGIRFAKQPSQTENSPVMSQRDSLCVPNKDVLDLVNHYNMIARRFLYKVEYYALSTTNPTSDEKWRYFEELYNMCTGFKYDPKVYIEAQFALAKTWKNTDVTYPLPHMLLSEKGRQWFLEYLKDMKEKYLLKEVKPQPTQSVEEEIECALQKDMRSLQEAVQTRIRQSTRAVNLGEYMCLFIYNHWSNFSPYYLYTVGWFHKFLDGFVHTNLADKNVKRISDYFNNIRNAQKWQAHIMNQVEQLEAEFLMPPHIDPLNMLHV